MATAVIRLVTMVSSNGDCVLGLEAAARWAMGTRLSVLVFDGLERRRD